MLKLSRTDLVYNLTFDIFFTLTKKSETFIAACKSTSFLLSECLQIRREKICSLVFTSENEKLNKSQVSLSLLYVDFLLSDMKYLSSYSCEQLHFFLSFFPFSLHCKTVVISLMFQKSLSNNFGDTIETKISISQKWLLNRLGNSLMRRYTVRINKATCFKSPKIGLN